MLTDTTDCLSNLIIMKDRTIIIRIWYDLSSNSIAIHEILNSHETRNKLEINNSSLFCNDRQLFMRSDGSVIRDNGYIYCRIPKFLNGIEEV